MILQKILSLTILLLGSYSIGFGQIKYKIALLNGKDLYQISLVSEQDFTYPNNIIGTAQISIKTPITGFELMDVNSLQEGVHWEHTAKIKGPKEAENFQYISFNLKSVGTPFLLEAGEELPLFTFKNELGNCPGGVFLVDNQTDSFLPPNSRNVNIGNQITPFGCLNLANKNAYSGNLEGGIADCALSTNLVNLEEAANLDIALYPNPAHNWIKLNIHTTNVTDIIEFQIWETGGKLIREWAVADSFTNDLQQNLNINLLAAGQYTLFLKQGSKTIRKNFVKVLQ